MESRCSNILYGYIYKTTNILNNKIYIGQKKSTKFLSKKYLGSGKYLKNAVNKYGVDNFTVSCLEWCKDKLELNERERYWIKYYKDMRFKLYNISAGGEGGDTFAFLSVEDREKRIAKMSKASYFNYLTPEQRKKVWVTRRKNGNICHTEEQKNKQIKSLKDFYKTEQGKQQIERIRERNILKGIKTKTEFINNWNNSPKYCLTCGKLMTEIYGCGKYCCKSCAVTHKHTEETKKHIGQLNRLGIIGNKGKHLKQEHKENISKANKNKKFSDEHKHKLSVSHRGLVPHNKGKKLNKTTGKFE